ncbi:MAG: glycosyltransferase [Bacteroidetes bacterium]|nr:glycosyltransferase [Bacteroidota bacterium]
MKEKIEKKRILFLTPRLPYPIIGGDKLKAYYMIKHLSTKYEVTLVSFYQGDQTKCDEYTNVIKQLGVNVFVIPLNPIKAGITVLPRLLRPIPLEVLYYTQKDYRKIVEDLLNTKKFDLVFSFFMRTAEYVKDRTDIKKILMCEDCRTLYQKRSSENSSNLIQKIVRVWDYHKLKKYEPNIVNFFDVVTLVTNEDINSMKQQNPSPSYKLLTNGVDINKFVFDNTKHLDNTILFAGKLDVWANELMINSIIDDILPIIKKEIPSIKLLIVGANPSKKIQLLAKTNKYIELVANVPDMLPYLHKANLFLHPHYGGSGIQNKLLEAMAAGCPVVTTQTGNQGIDAINNKEVLIGKTNEELAACAIKILKSKEFANTLAVNARILMEKTHSWEIIFSQLNNIVDNV